MRVLNYTIYFVFHNEYNSSVKQKNPKYTPVLGVIKSYTRKQKLMKHLKSKTVCDAAFRGFADRKVASTIWPRFTVTYGCTVTSP
jgi:hypothetical protein